MIMKAGIRLGLVPLNEVLADALKERYAVGHFNINNLEFAQAIVEAGAMEKSPVICGVSESALRYIGVEFTVAMTREAARNHDVPVALHLDHGRSFEVVMSCIRAGFSSVMIDGSSLSLEENIALTRKVVDAAHAVGVSVEAELGTIGGAEKDLPVRRESGLVDSREVEHFWRKTGVDALAIACGTAHGVYRGEVHIRFDVIQEVAKRIPVPLVLHGASGVPDHAVRQAIESGMAKVNINTDNQLAFTGTIRRVLGDNPELFDPRRYLGAAREAVRETVREKMRLFGSSGRA